MRKKYMFVLFTKNNLHRMEAECVWKVCVCVLGERRKAGRRTLGYCKSSSVPGPGPPKVNQWYYLVVFYHANKILLCPFPQ